MTMGIQKRQSLFWGLQQEVGHMHANECIKLLLGIGEPLYGRMLNYDGLRGTWDEILVKKADDCPVHGNKKTDGGIKL